MVGPQPLKLTIEVRILSPDPLHDPLVPKSIKNMIQEVYTQRDEYLANLPGPSVNHVREIKPWTVVQSLQRQPLPFLRPSRRS